LGLRNLVTRLPRHSSAKAITGIYLAASSSARMADKLTLGFSLHIQRENQVRTPRTLFPSLCEGRCKLFCSYAAILLK
jgi:hypothetical protein